MPYLPGNIQFIITHKVGVVPLESVQDQCFVRLRDMNLAESTFVRQVHVHGDRASVQAGRFCVQFEVHRLRWLDTNHELVSGNVFEDTLSDILELNSDLNLGLVQSCGENVKSGKSRARPFGSLPFPAFKTKGTPSQRGLLIHRVVAAKVGQTESRGTVSSSKYPGLPSAATYCPSKVSCLSTGGIARRTLT